GFTRDDPNKVLILAQSNENSLSVELLSLQSGQITPLHYDKQPAEDQLLLTHFPGRERLYADTKVYVKRETKMGMAGNEEWTVVYYKQGAKEPVDLSSANGNHCSQPALSHNGHQVVFVQVKH